MVNRVLVVDDEERTRTVLEECLKYGGYEVFSASNGEEGLTHLANFRPDIVITDMLMPNMNGHEFSNLVKEVSDVPIIMMTGLGIPANASDYAGLIDVYLPKPIGLSALLDEVESVLVGNRSDDPASRELVG